MHLQISQIHKHGFQPTTTAPIPHAIIVDDIIANKVGGCQKNNNLVLAQMPMQCPFTCGGCIFNERKFRIVNDIGMGLIHHSPNINIVLTFQNKLNDINVCDQPFFVHIHYRKSLDNLIIYEFTLLHLHLVHIMSCHNHNESSFQTINVTSLEAFCLEKKTNISMPHGKILSRA
jgi:hypothetical protein